MRQTKKGMPPHILISVAATLAIVLLVLLGAAAYWRLESLAWESHSQAQVALDFLRQRTEEVDEEMAAVLQELQTLKREQVAVQSRVGALEAWRSGISDLRSDISDLDRRLDDLFATSQELVALSAETRGLEDSGGPPIASDSLQNGLPVGEEQSASAQSSRESTSAIAPEPVSLGVPIYKQTHSLSCEATSASMVAAFFGVSLPEEEAIARLPRHENPHLGFRGDVDGQPGGHDDYGVYAGPIQTLLAEYGLRATHIDGGLEGIRRALAAGHPVIAWVTYHLWEQNPVELELASGARIRVVPYEHTVVIEGVVADGLWALDPYDGAGRLLPWTEFERSWGYLDQMALEVSDPEFDDWDGSLAVEG